MSTKARDIQGHRKWRDNADDLDYKDLDYDEWEPHARNNLQAKFERNCEVCDFS